MDASPARHNVSDEGYITSRDIVLRSLARFVPEMCEIFVQLCGDDCSGANTLVAKALMCEEYLSIVTTTVGIVQELKHSKTNPKEQSLKRTKGVVLELGY